MSQAAALREKEYDYKLSRVIAAASAGTTIE